MTLRDELQREYAEGERQVLVAVERNGVPDRVFDVVRAQRAPQLAELRLDVDPEVPRLRARALVRVADRPQQRPLAAPDIEDDGALLDEVSRVVDAVPAEVVVPADGVVNVSVEVAGALGECTEREVRGHWVGLSL